MRTISWTFCIFCIAILAVHCVAAAPRDTYRDTWVGADALGRPMLDNAFCGDPAADKTVGLFYFLWHKETAAWPIKDISKILAGQDSWGGASSFHHWGESLLGYYSSEDEYVIGKHFRMIADAGVDFIFFDTTNGPANTYETTYKKVLAILQSIRDAGEKVPQAAFLVNSDMNASIEKIYADLYARDLYPELWFRRDGKPLLMGHYSGANSAIRDFFTFKRSWAWTSQPWYTETAGQDRWAWLDSYPQQPGYKNGLPEHISVAAASHPHGVHAIGKSCGADITRPPVFGNDGKYIALQWQRALQVNPPVITVTQWNEWIAQRFIYQDPVSHVPGVTHMVRRPLSAGDSIFIDVYSSEYSRDLEPMKGGYGDNYYMQLVNHIRQYKGVRPHRAASEPTTITINTDFSQWAAVGPDYLDDLNDVIHRNHVSFGSDLTYTDTTGRNDLDTMKVAHDQTYLYFYVKTRQALTAHTDARWMTLLINADADYSTGWNGYDHIVNHTVDSATSTTLKTNAGGTATWAAPESIRYAYAGDQLHVRVPAASLGITLTKPFTLDFKWADNSLQSGDIMEFYLHGDAAPNNRFNYRYHSAGAAETAY